MQVYLDVVFAVIMPLPTEGELSNAAINPSICPSIFFVCFVPLAQQQCILWLLTLIGNPCCQSNHWSAWATNGNEAVAGATAEAFTRWPHHRYGVRCDTASDWDVETGRQWADCSVGGRRSTETTRHSRRPRQQVTVDDDVLILWFVYMVAQKTPACWCNCRL